MAKHPVIGCLYRLVTCILTSQTWFAETTRGSIMRKMMTKEVSVTKAKCAFMEIVDGLPVATTLPDETLMGNVSMARAQKMLNDKHNKSVTVFDLKVETLVYEMEVEEFIKHATLRAPIVEAEKEHPAEPQPQNDKVVKKPKTEKSEKPKADKAK